MKKNLLTVLKDGKQEIIEVIKYFTLKTNGNDYIIYKRQHKSILYAAQILESNDEIILEEIKEEQIKKEVTEIMKGIQNG